MVIHTSLVQYHWTETLRKCASKYRNVKKFTDKLQQAKCKFDCLQYHSIDITKTHYDHSAKNSLTLIKTDTLSSPENMLATGFRGTELKQRIHITKQSRNKSPGNVLTVSVDAFPVNHIVIVQRNSDIAASTTRNIL